MRITARIATVVLCVVASSCGESLERVRTATLTIRATSSSSMSDIARAQAVVVKRLNQFLPKPESSLSSEIVGDTIRVNFYGPPPDEHMATVLCTEGGELRVSLLTMPSDVWVSDVDVEDARLFKSEEGVAMEVRVNKAAGQRLLERTTRNIGRQVRISWNGKAFNTATIQSPFGEVFQFTAPPPPEGLIMRVMLQSGRLPIQVDAIQFHSGA